MSWRHVFFPLTAARSVLFEAVPCLRKTPPSRDACHSSRQPDAADAIRPARCDTYCLYSACACVCVYNTVSIMGKGQLHSSRSRSLLASVSARIHLAFQERACALLILLFRSSAQAGNLPFDDFAPDLFYCTLSSISSLIITR